MLEQLLKSFPLRLSAVPRLEERRSWRRQARSRPLRNGADYIVVGRPIRNAADPYEAAMQIQGAIEGLFLSG